MSKASAAPSPSATALFTAAALIAFASNSLLTREALGAGAIDAATFTLVRLAAGAATLVALAAARSKGNTPRPSGWTGPLLLFLYAAPFSFAYVRIGAAVGALVLFGFVQITMIVLAWRGGERPGLPSWLGIALASAGLAVLTVPAVGRPDPAGIALMAVAGTAWGIYSIAGRGSADALAANARSFLWSVPLALVLYAVSSHATATTIRGVALAVVSGAVTSGLGYAIWFRALAGLTRTQAAVVQLAVPVIAALGAIVFLGERPSMRLGIAAAAILVGAGLVVAKKRETLAGRQSFK